MWTEETGDDRGVSDDSWIMMVVDNGRLWIMIDNKDSWCWAESRKSVMIEVVVVIAN